MALVSVDFACESRIDTEPRYFGKSVNEPLNADFWVSEPRKVVGVFRGSFGHSQTWGMPAGSQLTFEFNTSAPSSAGWICNVYVMQIKDGRVVKDMFVATGWMGYDIPPIRVLVKCVLKNGVEDVEAYPAGGSAEPPARQPSPEELIVAPSSPPPAGVPPEKYAAPPPKPWYVEYAPLLVAGAALIGGLWYLRRRGYGSS